MNIEREFRSIQNRESNKHTGLLKQTHIRIHKYKSSQRHLE